MAEQHGSTGARVAPDVGSSGGKVETGVRPATRVPWRNLRLMSSAELARRASAAGHSVSDSEFADGLPFTMSLD